MKAVFLVVFSVYRLLFARKRFYRLNKALYMCSLSGLGILNYKSYKESGEDSFLKQYFISRQGGIVLDVGANVGKYSKLVLAVNPQATVYAFEPHPITCNILSDTLIGQDVEVYNVAVGDSDGDFLLYDYEEKDGSSHASLYKDVIESIHKEKSIAHEVKVIKLDDFLQEKNIECVSLLKIDAEGHELAVLKGAKDYIDSGKINAIHFEFNTLNVVSRVFFKDFWEILQNYDFYRMVKDGLVPIKNYDPVFCEIFAYQNIVARLKNEFIKQPEK